MNVACFIESDLSMIRLIGDGVNETWRAPADPDEEPTSSSARMTARARAAALWTTRRLGRSHRLGAVCIGLDEALCARVLAPSPNREVIAAAMNQREQDWLSSIGASTVEALSPPARESKSRSASDNDGGLSSHQFTVLDLRDGPIRLWLDELDRQGVSAEPVLTLWHAMVNAWDSKSANSDEVTAILLDQPDRCVWTWSLRGKLIAAGSSFKISAGDDHSQSSIPQRLSLDWLTWGAKLGASPASVIVIAADTRPILQELASQWPGVRIDGRDAEHPLVETLEALTRADIATDDPRVCLTALSNRPGRAHRRLAVWTVAAILLLAAGISGLGWRQHLAASEAHRIASAMQQSIRDQVAAIEPALADNADPARALRSVLAQAREENQSINAPSSPLPMFNALAQLGQTLLITIGESEDANVRSIKFDEISVDVQIAIPDFATGEAIIDHLRANSKHLRWSSSFSGAPPTTQILRAVWVIEEDA